MRIAIFDYKIVPTNPIGGCHLRMLRGLCYRHDFTVFAIAFENPCPERIRFVRVPAPARPLALLFVVYHLMAPLCYWWHLVRTRARFDLKQSVESNCIFSGVSYSQFCHRRFLDRHWPSLHQRGVRGILRWLDHSFHAALERTVYQRARRIVVASHGLARELKAKYPLSRDRILIVPNPVDLPGMKMPASFERTQFRLSRGLGTDDVVLVFVALGHFERKGLPLLLEAMTQVPDSTLKLSVVGGEPGLVNVYRSKAREMGLENRVIFEGMRQDVREFLWGADAFVLPSAYEVFPLVALEAAAAGLPIISSQLNGVEEILRDGQNGFLVERTGQGIAKGIGRFLSLNRADREGLGRQAQHDVGAYSIEAFSASWQRLYEGIQADNGLRAG